MISLTHAFDVSKVKTSDFGGRVGNWLDQTEWLTTVRECCEHLPHLRAGASAKTIFLVAEQLADSARPRSGVRAMVTVATLASVLGLTSRQVQRAKRALKNFGLLEVTQRGTRITRTVRRAEQLRCGFTAKAAAAPWRQERLAANPQPTKRRRRRRQPPKPCPNTPRTGDRCGISRHPKMSPPPTPFLSSHDISTTSRAFYSEAVEKTAQRITDQVFAHCSRLVRGVSRQWFARELAKYPEITSYTMLMNMLDAAIVSFGWHYSPVKAPRNPFGYLRSVLKRAYAVHISNQATTQSDHPTSRQTAPNECQQPQKTERARNMLHTNDTYDSRCPNRCDHGWLRFSDGSGVVQCPCKLAPAVAAGKLAPLDMSGCDYCQGGICHDATGATRCRRCYVRPQKPCADRELVPAF